MIAPGTRFGRLVVIEDIGHHSVRCRCDCGVRRTVRRDALRTASSCGCLRVAHRGATMDEKGARR